MRTWFPRARSRQTPLICAALLLAAGFVQAQDPNLCDETGEAPDLIVGEIFGSVRWGSVGEITAYSFGTDSCNVGTCEADWIAESNRHPVIGQNLFRLRDGRFEQIGQSWLKHGFATVPWTTCSEDCLPSADDQHLGVNCSDAYSAQLNGARALLGPKFEVNALSGVFPYPATDMDLSGDAIYKRLQVHNADLDPALNPGALYFVEAQYVSRDDSDGGNQNNNASYRPAEVSVSPTGEFEITLVGQTEQELPAILAWKASEPDVDLTIVNADGQFYVAARVTDLGGGRWHYEYAIQNLNSHRSARSFTVPVSGQIEVSNIGFHDVDYHSGEPFDGTDWPGVHDQQNQTVVWSTSTFSQNPDANALRWGTLYNFWFDADLPPVRAEAVLGLFRRSVSGDEVFVNTLVPLACDNDGLCEAGENCNNCPADCEGVAMTGFCGDGICDPLGSENCVSCPQDCNGVQGGNPNQRFCCGDGGGENPVACSDARCNSSGFVCATPCCGDGACDPGEDSCGCAVDCGSVPPNELLCEDGADDDCDGRVDCDDVDCCFELACADGVDADGDSVAECDCDDANSEVWAGPGEVRDLVLAHDVALAETTLTWTPPIDLGGTAVIYSGLRSQTASDFVAGGNCLVLADPTQATATDGLSPGPGIVWHYLVRAENACPAGYGLGPLGNDSAGGERAGGPCP